MAEKNKINFKTKSSIKELKLSLKKSKNTSPGPDMIHYELLKHLPVLCLIILLDLLNNIWDGGDFPAV